MGSVMHGARLWCMGQQCNEPFLIETLMILTSPLSTALANVSTSSCEAPIPDAEFMLRFKVHAASAGRDQIDDDENKGLHCITRVSTKGEERSIGLHDHEDGA